ncbi:restriction endonuclease subunit S [Vaginisenegalia massiliensis]|uniref:restriction endonuclease subunit S n=1 Tax=Vaginisenegalia massiliensis TaxID=2058294 RepID=UPI0013DDA74D|nr:restriction endonuclease subunit S [Vaginisenegalia massiliensis]
MLEKSARFRKGIGYSKSDLIKEGSPIILYGQLYTNYETTIKTINTFVDEKENSIISHGREVIVPASGETSEDIARASAVAVEGVLIGGDINIIDPDPTINSTFLALSLSNGRTKKELAKKAQGKSVVHIRNEEIKKLNILFPIKSEQERLSDYFSNLDTNITLHHKKYFDTIFPLKNRCISKKLIFF